ncbi:DUF2070 family protein [Candidatus Micrarchaeota archaeon]|nr:DUF2070 family protein [Candidatus Micrarchaeota archaeon]
MDDTRNKFVAMSNILTEVPPAKKLSLYLLAASFIGGFALRFLHEGKLLEALVYGSAEGFWLLFLPAVLAAALSTSVFSRKFFKYFLLGGFASATFTAILYAVGVFAFNSLTLREPFVFFANALVFMIGFAIAKLILSSSYGKAAAVGIIHPFFNLSFLYLWNSFGIMEAVFFVEPNVLTILKFLVSSAVLLIAMGALFYVINAPAKRNFGVSTIQALTLFFGQWLQGKNDLEDFLGEFGDEVRTLFGAVIFRRKKDKTLKALFFVPHLHYGPFGNLGGSAFPAMLERKFSEKYGATVFTFHPLVTHDLNPLHASQFAQLEQVFDGMVQKASGFSATGFLSHTARHENQASVFGFGKKAFFSITRAPYSTEDYDLAAGWILRALAMKHYDDALVVDRHNSITDGDMFDVGSEVFENFENAVASLGPQKNEPLSLGTAEDKLEECTLLQGIGKAGMKVAVIGFGKKKACMVVIDANNALPEFRQTLLNRLAKHNFAFVDIFTTDTHSVNTIGGIHNPLGARTPDWLVGRIEETVSRALKNMEPIEAALETKRARFSVLGIKRQTELVSTVNSIVATAKILAPIILILSFALVFLAFWLVK